MWLPVLYVGSCIALGLIVLWAIYEHMQAAEWQSIVDHYETMHALDPESGAWS